MNRTVVAFAPLLLLAAASGAAEAAPAPADDAHDTFALALALQKQCGGLPLWEEIMLSTRVRNTWRGSRAFNATPPEQRGLDEAIERDRPNYAARAKTLGCEGGAAKRQEARNAIIVESLALLWLSDRMAQLPESEPERRIATRQEAQLNDALVGQIQQDYANQSAQIEKAVEATMKHMAAQDPTGYETKTRINLLFSALVLQVAADKGKLQIRLPANSDIDDGFDAVETATGKTWRGAGLPSNMDLKGKQITERPYALLLLGPDSNLAHILIDLEPPQPLRKSFVAPMRGDFAKPEEYAHATTMAKGCPWQACYAFTKADTDRLLGMTDSISWLHAYLEGTDPSKNTFSASLRLSDLKKLRARP